MVYEIISSCRAIMSQIAGTGDVVFVFFDCDPLLLAFAFAVTIRAFTKKSHKRLKKLLKLLK